VRHTHTQYSSAVPKKRYVYTFVNGL